MLFLRIELLTGRYVASSFNDRSRGEWPPHPARVYSALVAAHFESGAAEISERALRWMESLSPPAISCSEGHERDLKVHYVPVNDKALSDSAAVHKAWASLLAAERDSRPTGQAETKLRTAYERAGARKSTTTKGDPGSARHVLPRSRNRQPRSFPSVTPEEPTVFFRWEADPPDDVRQGLDRLAEALTRVGHSSSLVAASWATNGPEPALEPHERGEEVLRWISPGQLDTLEAMHGARPFAEQRVMPYVPARYRRTRHGRIVSRSRFAGDFVVLQRAGGARLQVGAVESVADAVRRALICHADEPVDSLISGHSPDGGPLEADHLAIVPVPYVGSRNASGDLLGVLLVPPANLGLAQLMPLHRALGRWEASSESTTGEPSSELLLGALGSWTLRREQGISPLRNLQGPTWTGPSRYWVTATPMVLDQHPGSLSHPKPRAVRRVKMSISAACARIGLPAPTQIEFSNAPLLSGSEHVSRFRRRPGNSDPRPLVHVRLEFGEAVGGPVLLGAARYRGLGLFRPVEPEQ